MKIYPKIYLDNVMEIKLEMLNNNGIKGIILDVDNTLINYDRKMPEGIITWCSRLKKEGMKFCIVSNTNKKEKVKEVAKVLDIPFITFAKKPFKKGFIEAKEILKLQEKQIAVVGDQIMTDIIGGNRAGMYTILTKPLDEKDILITKIKRPLEKLIIKEYLKKINRKI